MISAITVAGWTTIAVTLATLVLLEGLLSADNALVLAVMVRHLPKRQQRLALRYGIWGAFFFRFVAVLLATTILDYWQFEVGGGLYLIYLALSHLFSHDDSNDPEAKAKAGRGFWATVAAVEFADIAFSVDSILAAVALADEMPKDLHAIKIGFFSIKDWVIYAGGVLGIIAMRFIAGYFLILLDKFPGLVRGAYYLVGWIGVRLVGAGFHHALVNPEGKRIAGGWPFAWKDQVPDVVAHHLDMPGWLFWGGMAVIIILSLVIKPRGEHPPEGLQELAEEEGGPLPGNEDGGPLPDDEDRDESRGEAS